MSCTRILPLLVLGGVLAAAEQGFSIIPSQAIAIYEPNAPISWTVKATGEGSVPMNAVTYVLKKGGAQAIAQGTLDLTAGAGTITASLDAPGTILVEVTAKAKEAGQKDVKALAGVAVAPRQITPSLPVPDDFDAFWKDKLAELAAVPANPVLTEAPSERDGVDYWQITMDNIRGTKIRGQVAKPKKEGRFPALLIVQWAGVYKLPKNFVTGDAAGGWLVLNLNAHDLPIDEQDAFYKQQADGPLKGYTAIGNDDREQSYFLRMFLSCARGADYLASRPDWDGTTLVVAGNSQGGLQSLVAAGLRPELITALMVNVPAGCDNTAADAGRAAGWPNWINAGGGKDKAKVHETARYFDGMNFASRVRCPALVGMGLIDTTSRPDGVFAAINSMKGPVELVVMPEYGHQGKHEAFYKRMGAWKAAMVEGKKAPVQ
ncbi:MAG: acetylxylan esterase [Planctomycetes bacterium]|nr:acetylxylan esterase [Planctomycetota bacterium]